MARRAGTWLAACLILLCACARREENPSPGSGSASGNPVVLFDGTSLAGWTQAGPGGFRLTRGVIESDGGLGLLWYSDRRFGDFVLELDWRVSSRTDNSGVFLRFPDPGDDPWVAVREGYELQINDDPDGDPQKTGSVYGFQAARMPASRPVGDWNRYRIRVSGNHYTVWLNGVEVNRFESTDPGRGRGGYIGLQNHDAASRVQFRNIAVREL